MAENPEDQSEFVDDGIESDDPNVKNMRDHIKRLEKQLSEAADAEAVKRENAFLKAGVDLESKPGKLLFKAYDGNLEADDIRAEAAELNALKGEAPPTPKEETLEPGEEQSTEERQIVATGAEQDDPKTVNPRTSAVNEGRKILEDGGTREDAISDAFATIAIAGYKDKDDRVLYKGNQY